MHILLRPNLDSITQRNEELMDAIKLLDQLETPDNILWRVEGVYNVNKSDLDELQERLDNLYPETTYSTEFGPLHWAISEEGDISRHIKYAWECLDNLITPDILEIFWLRLGTINKRINNLGMDSISEVYHNFDQGWSHWNVAYWKTRPAYNLYMCDKFFKVAEGYLATYESHYESQGETSE